MCEGVGKTLKTLKIQVTQTIIAADVTKAKRPSLPHLGLPHLGFLLLLFVQKQKNQPNPITFKI